TTGSKQEGQQEPYNNKLFAHDMTPFQDWTHSTDLGYSNQMMILPFTLFIWDHDQASRHSGLKMSKNTTSNIVFAGFGWRDKRSRIGVAGKHFKTPIDVVLVFRPDLAACIGPQFENDELMGYQPL